MTSSSGSTITDSNDNNSQPVQCEMNNGTSIPDTNKPRDDGFMPKGTSNSTHDYDPAASPWAARSGHATAANRAEMKATPCIAFSRFQNIDEDVEESNQKNGPEHAHKNQPYQQWQLTSRLCDAAFWAGGDGHGG